MRPLCAIGLIGALLAGAAVQAQSPGGDVIRPQARPEVRAVVAAVEAAVEKPQVSTASNPSAPQPAALTAAEARAFRTAIGACWNTGALDAQARATSVTVGFSMTAQGLPVKDSFHLIGAQSPPVQAEQDSFAVAKRAILRCAGAGYGLPDDKFARWEHIELTFAPERTRKK